MGALASKAYSDTAGCGERCQNQACWQHVLHFREQPQKQWTYAMIQISRHLVLGA